jgi:hypothetical protein
VGDNAEEGRVGIEVAGTGVGDGPSGGIRPDPPGIVVLTSAVITRGVEMALSEETDEHAVRIIIQTIR